MKHGFSINRFIDCAIQIFTEVDVDEFLSLPSKYRFGLTHEPISEENIPTASPLHGYLRIFGWFMQLVYHLQAGETKWAPTSPKIRQSMEFVHRFLWERLSIKIDYPTSQGGTTSTGNVVRSCFQRKNDSARDFLYWVTTLVPEEQRLLTSINTYLSVILRIFNSDERIEIEKFTTLCRDTYELIIVSFPWASITPTLHNILAHSTQLIDE